MKSERSPILTAPENMAAIGWAASCHSELPNDGDVQWREKNAGSKQKATVQQN